MSIITIYLSAVISFLLWEAFFWQPRFIYFWLVLFLVVVLLTNRVVAKISVKEGNFWRLVALPTIYSLASWSFILFWEGTSSRHLVAVTQVVFLTIWWEALFYYFSQTKQLQEVVSYFSWLILFLLLIVAYSCEIILGWPFWLIGLVLLAFLGGLFWQVFWWQGLTVFRILLYSLVLSLVMWQLFWGLAFWPTNIYISSSLLSAVYYLIVSLLRVYFSEKVLAWRQIRFTVYLASVVIMVLLFIAQWW